MAAVLTKRRSDSAAQPRGRLESLCKITPPLATIALVALAVATLYWARSVLIPIALVLLLSFLLGPVVAGVQKWGLGRVPAVLIVVGIATALLTLFGWLFMTQSVQLVNELPRYQAKIAERIAELRAGEEQSLLTKLQSFSDRVADALTQPKRANANAATLPPQPVRIVDDYRTWVTPILRAVTPLVEPIAAAGLVLILLTYTLIERESMRDRLVRLIGQGHIPRMTLAFDDAGRRISRYLLVQFIINVTFGGVIGVGLWLIGVPHALLWGIFAAFLRYIPIVGPWLAAILPLALSLFTANSWIEPLLVVLLFLSFEAIANLVVEPWLYGHTMGVSQCSLLMAIAFWTWLWGPMGLVLAAPLTVCLMILGRYVPALKFFDVMLGNDPPLSADLRFYQRLLAHNQDEASRIVSEQLRTTSVQEVFDQVIVPALAYARRDLEAGRLEDHEARRAWEISDEISEELILSANAERAEDADASIDKPIADPRIRVLACPARDDADDVALRMFQRLSDPAICDLRTVTNDRLTSEIVSQVEQDHPSIVCIVALPPGGIAHTRLICKRLRQRYPKLKIVVGRWGAYEESLATDREDLLSAGADLVGASMAETTAHLVQLLQFLRPAALENENGHERESARSPLVPNAAGS